MPERSYTVAEIDRMRSAIEDRWLYGPGKLQPGASQMSRSYKEDEKTKCVEEMLRTYMLAGIDPAELG